MSMGNAGFVQFQRLYLIFVIFITRFVFENNLMYTILEGIQWSGKVYVVDSHENVAKYG